MPWIACKICEAVQHERQQRQRKSCILLALSFLVSSPPQTMLPMRPATAVHAGCPLPFAEVLVGHTAINAMLCFLPLMRILRLVVHRVTTTCRESSKFCCRKDLATCFMHKHPANACWLCSSLTSWERSQQQFDKLGVRPRIQERTDFLRQGHWRDALRM
jgi:hypothetical protein